MRRTNAVEHVGSLGIYDYECRCQYCGDLFYVNESNVAEYFQSQYDAYVTDTIKPELGTTNIGKSCFQIPIPIVNFNRMTSVDVSSNSYIGEQFFLTFSMPDTPFVTWITLNFLNESVYFDAPFDGIYTLCFSGSSPFEFSEDSPWGTDTVPGKSVKCVCGSKVEFEGYNSKDTNCFYIDLSDVSPGLYSISGRFYINVEPYEYSVNSFTQNIGGSSSRATTFTGDIGIMGDDGQLTKVDGDQIFNETTNNYYNPYTDTSTTITDWNYDYSDRSYHLTTEAGDTVTVTYGDENITIDEGGETYNIYYVTVNESTPGGGGTGGDSTHTHTWGQPTASTPPTCTTSGSNTYTCSGCGETKTETVPATGHKWTVKQSVQTKYDDTGQLVQEGYTIYECSVCGEQYKSIDGTGPPGGGSSSGSGGSDDGESIWDKLGKLFGALGSGLLDLIGSFIGKLLDALISLAELIAEKLTAVVDVVLKIFDAVPGLFTGFLGFLSAAFPFIPEEIMLLITFGIAAVVFIGIIKAIRR